MITGSYKVDGGRFFLKKKDKIKEWLGFKAQ